MTRWSAAWPQVRVKRVVRALEDLRSQHLIGEVAYRIDETTIRPLLFHDYAGTAYYLTLDALRNFEKAAAIGSGPFVVPAIAFWFMATESYVSTIYKTCAWIDDQLADHGCPPPAGSRLRTTSKVVEKIRAVKEWVVRDCPPDPPSARLQEFATFRNALFHDLTTPAPRTSYAHTAFAPQAEKCNQADLLEAVNIAVETFAYFRWLFASADLMPSIHIGAACEKLDMLSEAVLHPAFADILMAKELTSRVTLTRLETCPAELRIHMQFLIRADGPTAETTPVGKRLIADAYQHRAVAARPVAATTFQVPNYAR
jgi:hypothetical protein